MKGDKELADKVVALGVFTALGTNENIYHIANAIPLTAHDFVRDWRVAGALMEKCEDVNSVKRRNLGYVIESIIGDRTGEAQNDSLPRAICEACVEALT